MRGDYRESPNGNNQQLADMPDNGEVGPVEPGKGVLEMHPNGYGFLRDPEANYVRQMSDPFVPGSMIEKYALREGVLFPAWSRPGRRQQGPRLKEILTFDGMPPEKYRERQVLRPAHPHQSRMLAATGNRSPAPDNPGHGPPDARWAKASGR